MCESGFALMGVGRGFGKTRAEDAAAKARAAKAADELASGNQSPR
jgi:cell division GTPase FtsZ